MQFTEGGFDVHELLDALLVDDHVSDVLVFVLFRDI